MDILTEKENVRVDTLLGHGGLFKTKEVGQRIMAAALNVPVAVNEAASEGGAWGIALLAAYNAEATGGEHGDNNGGVRRRSLEEFLTAVFSGGESYKISPAGEDINGFGVFMERYVKGLAIERAAIDALTRD